MAIKGATRKDPRHTYPIAGMKIYWVTKKDGKKIPMVNFLCHPKTSGKPYRYSAGIILADPDSVWQKIWTACFGRPLGRNEFSTAQESAVHLAHFLVENNAGLKIMQVKHKYESGGKNRFRMLWTSVEFVNLGDAHPGLLDWPEKSIPGEDIFFLPDADISALDILTVEPQDSEEESDIADNN